VAKGREIQVSSNPKGQFLEGVIGDTSLPGTIMQIQAGTAFVQGRPTYVAAAPGVAGNPLQIAVLLADDLQGFTVTTAYVIGTRCRLYCPLAGEEMNILCGQGGPTQAFTVGQQLMIAATGGVLIPATGSPISIPAVAMEAITVTVPGLVFVTITSE
jgi:hypothetical protein